MTIFKKKSNFIVNYCRAVLADKKKHSFYIIPMLLLTLFLTLMFKNSFSINPADGTVTGEILATLGITQTTEMDFGRILPSGSAGTATISKDADTITCVVGGVCTGSVSRGEFAITGSDGSVSITYTDAVISDGTETMAVDISSGTIANVTTATLAGGSGTTINVGGILAVGAAQDAGIYTTAKSGGSAYTVTVNY